MTEKKFCKRCKQLIKEKPKGLLGMFSKPPMEFYEFEDGFYCKKCGEIEVEEKRKKKND